MHGVPRPSGTSYSILLSTCHPLHPRAEAVANGKHCFRCLCRKYFSSACKKTAKCNVTDCSQWHHPLLHESVRVFLCRTGNAVAPIESLYINFPVLVAIVLIWVIVHNGASRDAKRLCREYWSVGTALRTSSGIVPGFATLPDSRILQT